MLHLSQDVFWSSWESAAGISDLGEGHSSFVVSFLTATGNSEFSVSCYDFVFDLQCSPQILPVTLALKIRIGTLVLLVITKIGFFFEIFFHDDLAVALGSDLNFALGELPEVPPD